MTKDDLMARWDKIVTDPRLTLELVNDHLQTITTDTYLFDEVHAVAREARPVGCGSSRAW